MALRASFRSSLRPQTLARQCLAPTAVASPGFLFQARCQSSSVPNPDPAPGSPSAKAIAENESYMVATYARPTPVFARGEGAWLYDVEDRKYLDFTAGIAVNSLGHCDPEFASIIAEQVCFSPLPLPTPLLGAV